LQPASSRQASPPEDLDDAMILPLGATIAGSFRILRMLGEGGMGQVFEAEDLDLNRRVAIKVARRGMPGVRHEASVLAALRHPAMVTVHHFGRHEDLEFLVMERIYGISLEARIDQQVAEGVAFELREAIDVLRGVAEGLAALHQAGVSHRDLKPGNVMLAPGGRVVLMDLGIAVAEADRASTATRAGSVGYMAPEALKNEIRRGDGHLLDIYALGVLAFHMLVGSPPFSGSNEQLIVSHVVHAPPRLDAHRPDVPAALTELVGSMLAKSPHDRPESAEIVADELRRMRLDPISVQPREPMSVLIVDDDSSVLRVVAAAVRSVADDIRVLTARSGEEALQAVAHASPDLILLDLKMPGMSGLEVVLHLRGARRTRGATIVLVSAAASPPDLDVLRELGVSRVVVKGPDLVTSVRHEAARVHRRTSRARPSSRPVD
jgi:serine/threonine protein kinase